MIRVSKGSSSFVPSSVLSIIGGSLMIIGGLLPLGMLGMSGHFGMMSEMDTGEMMGEMMEGESGMMPLQSFLWASVTIISAISIGTGIVLIVGGYLIYRKPESATPWGIAILVASIVSLLSIGGFIIGPILGIIGGILALTRKQPANP
jgi:hypothetical protein